MSKILERSEHILRIQTYNSLDIPTFAFLGMFVVCLAFVGSTFKEIGNIKLECKRENEQVNCTEYRREFLGYVSVKPKEFIGVKKAHVLKTTSHSNRSTNYHYTLHIEALKTPSPSNNMIHPVGFTYRNDDTIPARNLAQFQSFIKESSDQVSMVSIQQVKSFGADDFVAFLVSLLFAVFFGVLFYCCLFSQQVIIDKRSGTIATNFKFLGLFLTESRKHDTSIYKSIKIYKVRRNPDEKKNDYAYEVVLLIKNKKYDSLGLFDSISLAVANEYAELINSYLPNIPIEYYQNSGTTSSSNT